MAQIERAYELCNLLNKYRMSNSHDYFASFHNLLEEKSGCKLMVDKLLDWAKATHCNVIGNKNHRARNHYENILSWVEQEMQKKDDGVFKIFTFAFFFIGSISLFLNFVSMSIHMLIIITLLSYICANHVDKKLNADRL